MKILHTADWHLGKKLEDISRLPEQKEVMAEICQIADEEQVDAVLIAGDLFDSFNPSTEAIELFYQTLSKLSNFGQRPVIAIAGNHDSPDRIEAPSPLAKESGIILLGYPDTKITPFTLEGRFSVTKSDQGFVEILINPSTPSPVSDSKTPNQANSSSVSSSSAGSSSPSSSSPSPPSASSPSPHPPLRIIATPYANELRLKKFLGHNDPESELRNVLQESWQSLADKYCDDQGINILMTHLFFINKNKSANKESSSPHSKESISNLENQTQTTQSQATELTPEDLTILESEESEDEKSILHVGGAQPIFSQNVPPQIQYTALGHIHGFKAVATEPCPIVYSSSPLAYSFSEAGQDKHLVIIEAQPNKPVEIKSRILKSGKQLVRKTFESVEHAITWLTENQETIVELTMKTPDFLTAKESRSLHQSHPNIVSIIPMPAKMEEITHNRQHRRIDLNKNVKDLFKDYFQSKHTQPPNEEILNLLDEVLSQQENSVDQT